MYRVKAFIKFSKEFSVKIKVHQKILVMKYQNLNQNNQNLFKSST